MSFRVVVIISGRGSNLAALAKRRGNYEISAVISNNPDAPGLRLATELGIKTVTCPRKDYASVTLQKTAIFETVCKLNPDLVALAGYMQIAQPEFVESYFGRLINIHPSLLPAYPGIDTHDRVLAAGEKFHGCTVHYVDQWVDNGPLVAQVRIPVPPGINSEALGDLVLEQEHKIYPFVVSHIAQGNIALNGRKVAYNDATIQEATQLGFTIF